VSFKRLLQYIIRIHWKCASHEVFLTFRKWNVCFSFSLSPADGIFGRCQRVPVRDIYKYDISPPVLQRLRIILEKLSHRGIVKTQDWELVALRIIITLCFFYGDIFRSCWAQYVLQAQWCRFYKSKKPSDSLNLQWGLDEAIQERCFFLIECLSVIDAVYNKILASMNASVI